MNRQQAIRELERILHQLEVLSADVRTICKDLSQGGKVKQPHPYDVPQEDPEVVAARFGVDLDPPGDIPDWVAARIPEAPRE
jgi:hypothetical protein